MPLLRLQCASFILCCALFGQTSWSATNEPGVSADAIKIGSTKNLSSLDDSRPPAISAGQHLFFDHINHSGGIFGRRIDFVEYDDAYDPKRSVENVKRLLDQDKVFLIFGTYGTANLKSMAPIIARAQASGFAVNASLGSLSENDRKGIFSVKGSYADEAKEMVATLYQRLKYKRMAIFSQGDALGLEGRGGVIKALREMELEPVFMKSFSRQATEFDDSWAQGLIDTRADSLIVFGNEKGGLKVLELLKRKNLKLPLIVGSSLVAKDFIKTAAEGGSDVYFAQSYPFLTQTTVPVVSEYLSESKKAGSLATESGLIGYIDASILVEAFRLTGQTLTREAFLKTVLGHMRDLDVKGMKVSFGPERHSGSQQISISKVKNGVLTSL